MITLFQAPRAWSLPSMVLYPFKEYEVINLRRYKIGQCEYDHTIL